MKNLNMSENWRKKTKQRIISLFPQYKKNRNKYFSQPKISQNHRPIIALRETEWYDAKSQQHLTTYHCMLGFFSRQKNFKWYFNQPETPKPPSYHSLAWDWAVQRRISTLLKIRKNGILYSMSYFSLSLWSFRHSGPTKAEFEPEALTRGLRTLFSGDLLEGFFFVN